MAGAIHVGVGGWDFDPWRGTFYPPGLAKTRQLAYLGTRLNATEINATYYKTQSPELFARWAKAVPDGFKFAIKASRFCTNRKMLGDVVDLERPGDVGEVEALRRLFQQQRAHGIGELLAAAVADAHVHPHAIGSGGAVGRGLEAPGRLWWQQLETAHQSEPPPSVGREPVDQAFDGSEDARELSLRTLQVVGGEHPERHRADPELVAPLQELIDLRGAGLVAALEVASGVLRPAPIAVDDGTHVTRETGVIEATQQSALVGAVEKVAHVHGANLIT